MRPTTKIYLILIVFIFLQGGASGHVEKSQTPSLVGIDQKLGQPVPLDLAFDNEDGNRVRLEQLISRPTILALVYYHCPNVCSLLLQNLAGALNRLAAEPGKDYNVLAVSFDETEKPGLARERKKVYLQMIKKTFPEEAWRFLTGDRENIQKLADAVGFQFQRAGDDFEHPVSLIVLSREGRVVRYLFGTDILPLDLRMAILEASQGRVGPAISKVVRFCFSYDPGSRRYVFNTLKVVGTVTILFALSFFLVLIAKGKKNRPREG